eukprot:s744_g26.t1
MAEVVPLKCLLQLYYTAQNEPFIMSRWSLLSVKAWTSCLLAAGVLASQAQADDLSRHCAGDDVSALQVRQEEIPKVPSNESLSLQQSASESQMFTELDPVMRMIGNFLRLPYPEPNQQIRMNRPLIFMHQAKSGGTSLRELLYNASMRKGWKPYIQCYGAVGCQDFQAPKTKAAVYAGHFCWDEFAQNLHRRGVNEFSCVTNFRKPFYRILSCYSYRAVGVRKDAPECMAKLSPDQLRDVLLQVGCVNEPFRRLSGECSVISHAGDYSSQARSEVWNSTLRNLAQCVPLFLEEPQSMKVAAAYFPQLSGSFLSLAHVSLNETLGPCSGSGSGFGGRNTKYNAKCNIPESHYNVIRELAKSEEMLYATAKRRMWHLRSKGTGACAAEASSRLDTSACNSSRYLRERATLLGNLSAAQLARGSPERALEAARSASGMDTAYTKAYFREAKALLALGRPCAAVSAARRLYFVAGMDRADREVRNLLDAAAEQLRKRQHRPRVSCSESSSAPASDLESTVDLPDLVADCCNGEELVQLSQTSRRLRKQLFSEEALLCRASQLCHSRSWLRRDAAFGQSAGWAYAIHLAHARSSIRDRLAVCRTDGKVALVDPETGDQQLLPVPGHGVDFTLCWGPRSEFVAFTAMNKASGAALIVIPTLQRSQPLVIPLIPFLTPYYLSPSPCGTRIALLGSVRGQQALLVADVAQLLVSCRGEAPVARLCCLGTAAPLYFDWAPHGPELVLACNENKLARIRADVLNEVEDSVQTLPCCEPAEDNDIEQVQQEAERHRRAAEQALRRVEEQEKELGQLEDHVAGLEEQLAASQSSAQRQAAELREAQDQVGALERELRELRETCREEPENSGRRKTVRLSKAEMSKDGRDFQGQFQSLYVLHLLKEDTAGYRAAEAMEAIKREHDEAMKAKQSELDKNLRSLTSLQEQHMQLQQYCEELRAASHEIQGYLETAESENIKLHGEIEELREVMEAHHLHKALKTVSEKRGSLQLAIFAESDSLAHELQMEEPQENQQQEGEAPMQKTRSVSIAEEEEAPKPRREAAARRRSSSVGASKLAALQEEYEEKFESQTPACMRGAADVGTTKKHCGLRSQQLQVALQNKERIEKEKQEAIDSLQKQIEELKGKVGDGGGDALAGLFKMMSRIKDLTTEASDAVLLGFAPPEEAAMAFQAARPPDASAEAQRAEQALRFRSKSAASDAQVKSLDSLPGTVIQGRISFRAPQWLPWPDAAEGRWLVPTDAPQTGRVSLALVDPASGRSDTVCENLAPEAHFTATPGWVAWCGLHDNRGHGGVFARRVLPSMGPPISVFAHANRVEGMSWGGDRLALLIHAPNCLVWAVWDPVEAARTGNGLYVAPQGFIPGRSFSGRVLPFFDQFERRVDYWNPGHDALVYADFNAEVWVQPFPRPPQPHSQEEVHPLQSLAGAQSLSLAPPRRRIAAGSYACWSPS